MKVMLTEGKRKAPNFGAKKIDEVPATGDSEKDFNNAMVALRDDNYEAFIQDLNTLASDPKVAALRDAIIDNFNSPNGVKVRFSKAQPMDIKQMHSTQFEVDMEKSLAFPLTKKPEGIDQAFSGKPVCINNTPLVVAEVSGVCYIIDGHHRWSQIYCLNPSAQMLVRVIQSDMFKGADDVLKLVQMQLFIATDGGKLPQALVESPYNLYTIDEDGFRTWCAKNMSEDAKQKFAQYLGEKDPIDYLWGNVLTMRKYARPTDNAHERGDMPQTDKVGGEYMKPTAQPVSETTKEVRKMKRHIKRESSNKEEFKKWLKRHWNPALNKPKGQDEWDQVTAGFKDRQKKREAEKANESDWDDAHPEIACDRCGFTDNQEDYFQIVDGQILCDQCARQAKKGQYDEDRKKSSMHSNDAAAGWFGIKDAQFIYHGDWNDPEVEYKGVSLNYWDIESGLLEVYRDEHPEDKNDKGFDKWMADHPEEIRSELEMLYDAEMEYRANNPEEQYDESWVGDKAKAGWNKVKDGAKKVAKAVGDAFKGPFRKGDHIVMKGEDGETYKGTIKGFDLGDKTYEVLLGNPVNEDLQEDVLEMPDRVDELDEEIDRLWRRLGDVDDKTVSKLILACIELEKLEPGRIVDALGDYANFIEK